MYLKFKTYLMTNYMAKSSSGRICFTSPAESDSGRISQKQIRCSPREIYYYFLWMTV